MKQFTPEDICPQASWPLLLCNLGRPHELAHRFEGLRTVVIFDTSEVAPSDFAQALDDNHVLRIALATGSQAFILAGTEAPDVMPYLSGRDELATVVCLPRCETTAERHHAAWQAHRRISGALACRPCGIWLGFFGPALISYRVDERVPAGRQIVEFLPSLPGCRDDDGWPPAVITDILEGQPTGGVQ